MAKGHIENIDGKIYNELKISRTIMAKVGNKQWKPTFEKHKWLETLEIYRVLRNKSLNK